jgi:Zn-dependent protease
LTLFTWNDTPVRLHSSFLWLAGLYGAYQLVTAGAVAAATAMVIGAAVFGSVLLHEMGHVAVASRFGIRTRSITLYPFGGLAALEGEPESPRAEALIALAGPAVNMALAVLAVPLVFFGLPGATTFLGLNLVLGIFNLLPAFPMDGGRVLRAWWTRKHGRTNATLKALRLARGFAWAFIGLGLLTQGSLVLVGGFLLFFVRAEQRRWRSAAVYQKHTGQEAPWTRPDFGSGPQGGSHRRHPAA